jgi:hypothetical protein
MSWVSHREVLSKSRPGRALPELGSWGTETGMWTHEDRSHRKTASEIVSKKQIPPPIKQEETQLLECEQLRAGGKLEGCPLLSHLLPAQQSCSAAEPGE